MPDRRTDAFQRALDEAAANDRASNDSDARPIVGLHVRGVAFGPAPGLGGKARFGLALDWTDDPPSRAPPPQASKFAKASGDTPAEIDSELRLSEVMTLDQLTSRWRDFVWRNHPDRQPEEARERANARVAIANTLYDRARRALVSTR